MSPPVSRDLDIILVGATGFVGRLTAMHLARYGPANVRIGLAGRSAERLDHVQRSLPAPAQEWPLKTLDITDPAAVKAVAGRARVVVSTVGPYLRHGLPLVQACAEAGTDYADVAGETLFVRRSIDACDSPARETGSRIVHACGFDSVPSDLGVGLTAARAAADGQGRLSNTVLHVHTLRGGLSGGTIDSMRQQIIQVRSDPALHARVRRALALVDGPAPKSAARRSTHPRRRVNTGVSRDVCSGNWQARFAMGGFNRQIVLRSSALAGWLYGSDFRYREVVDTGRGPIGAAKAAMVSAGTTAFMIAMFLAPTRRVLNSLLPDPGQGPSEQTMRRGHFLVEVVAETTTGARYRTRIGADCDPGYRGTAVMLGESALCLAADKDMPDQAGVLTPMTAMGEALAVRLRARGFTVSTGPA